MGQYIARRLLQLLIVILGVTLLTFIVTMRAPSDPAEMSYLSMGIVPTDAQLAQTRESMGLNDPFILQYVRWLYNLIRGDLGVSYNTGESVFLELARKLPETIKLAVTTLSMLALIALPLGVFTAVKSNKPADYVIRFISFFGISMPGFLLGLLIMYVFGVKLQWFPIIGTGDFRSMLMPVLTLGIPMVCNYTRQIRIAVLEELSSDYVTGIRSRGIRESRIMFFHVLPNAMVPIITLLGLSIGHLLGGAAIVETIFGWQGIGNMVVGAIRVRDYPIIQSYVVWMAVIYVLVNLVVDITHHLMDPQLRRGGKRRNEA